MTYRSKLPSPLRHVATAVLALGLASSAHAFDSAIGDLASYPNPGAYLALGLGAPFADTLTFSLSSSTLASFTVQGQTLNLGFTIPPAGSLAFALYKGSTLLAGPGTAFSGLLGAGSDYSFKVSGTTGLYTMNWCLSPVPEPASMALSLAGLGVMGLLVRRRKAA